MNAGTQQRNQVANLCRSDLDRAKTLADSIEDPWFKIQSYGAIIDTSPKDAETFANRAIKSAASSSDAYAIGALAWVISPCVRHGKIHLAIKVLMAALERTQEVQPASSRAEALFHVFQAAIPIGSKSVEPVLHALEETCAEPVGWRSSRVMRDVILMTAAVDHSRAKELLNGMPDSNYRRQAEKRLSEGKLMTPRGF